MSALVLAIPLAAVPARAQDRQMQVAFLHFDDERVRLFVDGKVRFDRVLSVPAGNARNGLTALAWLDLPACPTIRVEAGLAVRETRSCLPTETRNATI